MSLSWHDLGLLGSAGSTTYTYDTSGKRLSKTVNGVTTNFYYAGDLLVGQKKGNEVIEFMFDSKGDYFGLEYNGTPYYYIKNLQGDVIAICNNVGNTVVTYEYDAWGRLMSYTDITGFSLVTKNPIRYRGYYLDHETGFYYLKSRYYSAEICRFLSPDVLIDNRGVNTQNLFAYCANNPIKFVDASGTIHVEGTDSCGIVQKNTSSHMHEYLYGTTFSVGYTYGYAQGSHSYCDSHVVSTAQDTVAIQKTKSEGMSTGVGFSAGLVITITNANNIFDLEGYSKSVGGSIVYQSNGFSFEYMEFIPKSNSDALCSGFSIIIPIGAEIELHEYDNYTITKQHWKTPIVKVIERLLK